MNLIGFVMSKILCFVAICLTASTMIDFKPQSKIFDIRTLSLVIFGLIIAIIFDKCTDYFRLHVITEIKRNE
jgi:hypothetical protein